MDKNYQVDDILEEIKRKKAGRVTAADPAPSFRSIPQMPVQERPPAQRSEPSAQAPRWGLDSFESTGPLSHEPKP